MDKDDIITLPNPHLRERSLKVGLIDDTVKEVIERGELVDDKIVDSIIREKIKENDAEHLSAETMISYNKYIKRKEKQKMFLLLIIIAIVLCAFLTTAILSFNKTFFKTKYTSDFINGIAIPIPKYSYYRETGGMDAYTTKLKTLKQPDEVNVFIDSYLRSLEKIEYGNEIYYYDQENDFTILQYKINNAGKSFVNTIYITYAKGRIES